MADIKDLRNFTDSCELQELRSIGAYYSQTNKLVWSRIGRALTNVYWSDVFNYTQVRYDTNSLSDHTPLLIQFPQSPKAKTKFQYCDMWAKHENFHRIITAALPSPSCTLNLIQLKRVLDQIRPHLLSLNRSSFKDLREQQELDRRNLQQVQIELQAHPRDMEVQNREREMRARSNSILTSSISLLQQQCKQEWIKYGDTCSRLFFTKAKQRKLATYIYTPSKMLRVHGLRDLKMWVR